MKRITKKWFEQNAKQERAAALPLVLFMVVIGAVVALAITARTIQDIQRTGEEKLSQAAASQVESILDIISSNEGWAKIVDDGDFIGRCAGSTEACVLTQSDLEDVFEMDDIKCDEPDGAEAVVRFRNRVSDHNLTQDRVYEVMLDTGSAGSFQLSWTGSATEVLAKVYSANSVDYSYAFAYDSGSWGTLPASGNVHTVRYNADSILARIRAIGGNAVLTLDGTPTREAEIKASCYIDDVYTELVRTFPEDSSVPSCFDYVLFDGDTRVNEF